jgi:hypothetical protein
MHTPTQRIFKTVVAFSITLLACVSCRAQSPAESVRNANSDQIVLLNGDHVSGRIEGITSDSIHMLTQAMGEVTVSLAMVKGVIRVDGKRILDQESPIPSATKVASIAYVADSSEPISTIPSIAPIDTSSISGQPGAGSNALACNTQVLDSQLKLRPSIWTLGITTTPGESAILGTQSQYAFGGFMTTYVCEGTQLNESDFDITGQHTKSAKINKPSITTDTLEGRFTQKHAFADPSGAGIYGIADMFFNTSLGLALQKSFGVGLFSRTFGNVKGFSFRTQADVRYVNERFYSSSPSLNLAGVRIDLQSRYSKGRFSIGGELEPVPMFNDGHAFQAFGKVGPNYKLNPWVCLGLSEEEHYLGNAPTGFRKNYLASTLSLTIQHDSSPACK